MKRFAILALVAAAGWLTGCANDDHHNDRNDRSARGRLDDRGQTAGAQQQGMSGNPANHSLGDLETVAEFAGPMPTGVTVSPDHRIFVNFPRWGDKVDFTVAELKNGKPVPFPNAEINQYDPNQVAKRLVSVQSVVVDPDNRLWMLDTGSLNLGLTVPGGPKLVGVDLKTNQVVKTISFPPEVALPTTYLNDVRFDLRRGAGGVAYVTDSGAEGPNGIIVVDLDSGKSWRRLTNHPSVKAQKQFAPTLEGDKKVIQPLMIRPVPGVAQYVTIGADGIALSADGSRLIYRPLCGHHLYTVSTDALIDQGKSDLDVQNTIVDHGDLGYASDGLECDAQGRIYLTDYEHNAIHRIPTNSQGLVAVPPEGQDRREKTDDTAAGEGRGRKQVQDAVIAQGPKMIWPDTMCIANDGYLYFTANQLDRQKTYNEGKDLREKPYYLFRIKVDAAPVMLKK